MWYVIKIVTFKFLQQIRLLRFFNKYNIDKNIYGMCWYVDFHE